MPQQGNGIAGIGRALHKAVREMHALLRKLLPEMYLGIVFQQVGKLLVVGSGHDQAITALHIAQQSCRCGDALHRVGTTQDLVNDAQGR